MSLSAWNKYNHWWDWMLNARVKEQKNAKAVVNAKKGQPLDIDASERFNYTMFPTIRLALC
jgi:hypothetical protein